MFRSNTSTIKILVVILGNRYILLVVVGMHGLNYEEMLDLDENF